MAHLAAAGAWPADAAPSCSRTNFAASRIDIMNRGLRTMAKQPLQGRTKLIIDASGLGRVVSDLLLDQGADQIAMQMVAGQN